MDKPLINSVNPKYAVPLLKYHGIDAHAVSNVFKAEGFVDYNYLVDINCVFSNNPTFLIVDRTCNVPQPIAYHVPRPWQIPKNELSLDQALERRVAELESTGQKINVFWSGGIDSTVATTAFLKHLKDPSQLRIIYSPWSTYEHPEYLKFLSEWPTVDTIDMSGEVYLHQQLDGLLITGDTGDEMHASIDNSFLKTHGYDSLFLSWKDFFYRANPDSNFIDFCEKYFALSGMVITTLLQARWWFYTICKLHGTLNETKLPFFIAGYPNFDISRLIGFFDTPDYESYIYFNQDKIMPTADYPTWRQMLKDYCFEFDGLETWRTVHRKITSAQMVIYSYKKTLLNNQRYLLVLQDGTIITTPNLPLFSEQEFRQCHSSGLDYLFGGTK